MNIKAGLTDLFGWRIFRLFLSARLFIPSILLLCLFVEPLYHPLNKSAVILSNSGNCFQIIFPYFGE